MYTRSVFRPSSTPFLPLFLPLSGDHTIHSFGGDRLPFKISGNTHRALDTTTSTRRRGHPQASSVMGSPLVPFRRHGDSFSCGASSSSSRDGRRTGGAIDRDHALSLYIFLSSFFVSVTILSAFSRVMHKTIEKRSAKKRTLGRRVRITGDNETERVGWSEKKCGPDCASSTMASLATML